MGERGQRPRRRAIATALSAARLAPYRAAAGDTDGAIRLYERNLEFAAATQQLFHVVEVVMRNAMDEQLRRWNAGQRDDRGRQHSADWLLDPSHLVRRLVQADVLERARTRAARVAERKRRPLEHSDVLAQLSLGTWRYLLPDRDPGRRRLWEDALVHAFPASRRPVAALVRDVHRVLEVRNRIAHLEPLLDVRSTERAIAGGRRIVADIEEAVCDWPLSAAEIRDLIDRCPVPALRTGRGR